MHAKMISRYLFYVLLLMLWIEAGLTGEVQLSDESRMLHGVFSAQYGGSPAGEGIDRVGDNLKNTKFLTFHDEVWVAFRARVPAFLHAYSLISANDYPSRDPRAWVLEGSDDGVHWVDLDVREDITFNQRFQTRWFSVGSLEKPFTFYRFHFHNAGGRETQLAEIQLFGGQQPLTVPIARFTSDNASAVEGGWIQYFDISDHAEGRTWVFEGGSPGESDAKNPIVYYEKYGTYNVSLEIRSGGAESKIALDDHVVVFAGGMNGNAWGDFKPPSIQIIDLVSQTNGSRLFHAAIPDPVEWIRIVCEQVARTLYATLTEVPDVRNITIQLSAGDFVARKSGNGTAARIEISADYLEKVVDGDLGDTAAVKAELDGIFFHEITHVYAPEPTGAGIYDGESEFWAFTEGVADAVRIGAGLMTQKSPVTSDNRKWLGGYEITGFFLHYIKVRRDKHFLTKFMETAQTLKNRWSFDRAFHDTLGQGVDVVWRDYIDFIQKGHILDSDGEYGFNRDGSGRLLHPADLDGDWRLTINEVTGYGGAWKSGTIWPNEPNPISINYLTRAGAIWKGGEKYTWDANIGQTPQGWVNN